MIHHTLSTSALRLLLGLLSVPAAAQVEGRVIDDLGEPIAGARVSWSAVATGEDDGAALAARVATRIPTRGGNVTTDAEGVFRFDDVEGGIRVYLGVRVPGRIATHGRFVIAPTGAPEVFVVARAASLSGTVLDAERRPVAGATVEVAVMRDAGAAEHSKATADARGRFEVGDLHAGRAILEARHEGHSSARSGVIELAPGSSSAGIEIVLRTAAMISGRVLTEGGVPVAAARLLAVAAEGADPSHISATSDGEGRFELLLPRRGPYRLSVDQQGFLFHERVVVADQAETWVELALARGSTLRGVVRGPGGALLADAEISLERRSWSRRLETVGVVRAKAVRTARDGRFEIVGLEDGTYRVHASHAGGVCIDPPSVEVSARHNAEVEVRLGRGTTISGRVAGLEASDRRRLAIGAHNAEDPRHGQRVEITDEGGGFRIAAATPGAWVIYAQLAGASRYASVRVEVGAGDEAITADLDFAAGSALSGTVTRAGVPVVGAGIFVVDAAQVQALAITDAAGRYSIEGLYAGDVQLVVFPPAAEAAADGEESEAQHLHLAGDQRHDIDLADVELPGIELPGDP